MPEKPTRYGTWAELRILREAKGFRQIDLARRAGLARSYLSELEAGHKLGNAATLKMLAEALAVPATVLERSA